MKNGIVSKVISGLIVALVSCVVIASVTYGITFGSDIQANKSAVNFNKIEIKRVDKDVRTLIIEQKEFQKDTTKVLEDIKIGVARIETKLEE